jgi:putative transposase
MMKAIDRLYTACPWYGSRRLCEALRRQGVTVNRKRLQRLMRHMGIRGVLPRRGTSQRAPGHTVYPYLLRGVEIRRVDQVWSTDITYVPLRQGFMYLVAVMDWYSRYVLAWELSNSLDSSFCVEAVRAALAGRRPEIFNTDQGTQFTAQAFVEVLTSAGVRISMDGRGRALDNVFIERLWRSVKYEDIYLRDYETVPDLYRGLIRYFRYYNAERPHQALGYRTPAEVYRGSPDNGPSGLHTVESGRRLQYCQGEPPAEDGPVGPGKTKAITP